VDYGTWPEPLAIASVVVTIPLLLLFVGNRHLYPIAQREPKWVVISNLSFQFVIWMYLFEKQNPSMPLWWNKVYSQLGWGIMLCLYLVRTWKLYIDAGLTTERVQNKFGWFVAHRHYRTPRFLWKFIGVLGVIHCALVPVQFITTSANDLPARQSDNGMIGPLLFAAVVLSYFVFYSIFACKLRKLRDGFFIKLELGMVGSVGMLGVVLWLVIAVLRVKCLFPSCSNLVLWLVSTWMFGWSIVMPLSIAARDPRFSLTRCFNPVSYRARQTTSSRISSREDSDVSDYHTRESAVDVKRVDGNSDKEPMTEERMARLRHVPLIKFLTYPAGREAFRTFTVLEFSVENLLFVEAVKELGSSPHTAADVRSLYDRFVADSAPNQVNLPSVVVQRLKPRLEDDCDAKVFDEAVEHVYKIMQRDTFKRFQKTAEWAMHVGVFDVEKKPKAPHVKGNSVEMADANTKQLQPAPEPAKQSTADYEPSSPRPVDDSSTRASALDDVALNIEKSSRVEPDEVPQTAAVDSSAPVGDA